MVMNTNEPSTANPKANTNLKVKLRVPNSKYASRMPSCALSVTPTTEGEINLFLLMV